MLKTIKEGFKVLVSSIFYGYASVMIKNGSFETGDKYIKKSYKWSANEYTYITTKMLEGILRKKQKKYLEANKIFLSVSEILQKSNNFYDYPDFENFVLDFENEFGVIENKIRKDK